MQHKTTLGLYGQDLIERYLHKQNFVILAKNFRQFEGEVDLIAAKGSLIVFVEVKTRTSSEIDPAEVITASKQRKIARAAAVFLSKKENYEEYVCRFDVAIVSCNTDTPHISYIADAFQVDEYV
ncbi:MAG TPA: YraN family protein [Candidatus Babeliales bacterium]|jgi:putative endonuclease|nr:YraN family protein [Candidatus Babeliales bacterium]